MALNSLLAGKKGDAGKPKTSQYVGVKLDIPDFNELCSVVGVDPTIGGAGVFKVMIAVTVGAAKRGILTDLVKEAEAAAKAAQS